MASPRCIRCKAPIRKGEGRLTLAHGFICAGCLYLAERNEVQEPRR